jgi:hypothetical protein
MYLNVIAIEKDGLVVVLEPHFSADPSTPSSQFALVDVGTGRAGNGLDVSMGAAKTIFDPLTVLYV